MDYIMGLPIETRRWIAWAMLATFIAIALLINYMRKRHLPAKRWHGDHTYGYGKHSGRRLNRVEKVLARLRLI
jgi:hypothetical protein